MSNNSLRPPWLLPPAIRARHARLARLRRKGLLPPMSKAEARTLCSEAVTGRPGIEPAPPYPGIKPGGIADRAMRMSHKPAR